MADYPDCTTDDSFNDGNFYERYSIRLCMLVSTPRCVTQKTHPRSTCASSNKPPRIVKQNHSPSVPPAKAYQATITGENYKKNRFSYFPASSPSFSSTHLQRNNITLIPTTTDQLLSCVLTNFHEAVVVAMSVVATSIKKLVGASTCRRSTSMLILRYYPRPPAPS